VQRSPLPFDASLESPAEGLTILIVDDDANAAEDIAFYLRQSGHHVQVALNGRSALETAQVNQPDVAVLGQALPDMNGDQVAESLMKQGRWKRPFLILLGANQSANNSGKTGFDLRMVKPVNLNWLRMLLRRLEAILRPAGDMPSREIGRISPQLSTCP